MTDFSKFDSLFNTEELKTEMESLPDFEELGDGKYIVKLDNSELKESSNGNPMVTTTFEVSEGEHKGRKIFYNQVITKAFQIKLLNKFLQSMVDDDDVEKRIVFESYSQYAEMLTNLVNIINMNKYTYELQIKTNNKGYKNFTIFDIF